jgi:disease resistance protein RPM1
MELATVALGTLLPKLAQLLQQEHNLHKGARKDVEILSKELQSIHAALCSAGEVPTEQLSELVRIWARDVRDLSYNVEDVVDAFLARAQDPAQTLSKRSAAKRFITKIANVFTKKTTTTRPDIEQEIEKLKESVRDVAERRDRLNIDRHTSDLFALPLFLFETELRLLPSWFRNLIPRSRTGTRLMLLLPPKP